MLAETRIAISGEVNGSFQGFDLFARLVVMDSSIRRASVDGVTYFVVQDVLLKLTDSTRKTSVRQFWHKLKKSPRLRKLSLNLRHIHFGGRGRPVECGDYAAILYIAMSLPDDKANLLRAYVADRLARMSEPKLNYLLRQQSEGRALAAEYIRHQYETGYLPMPELQTPAEEIGLVYAVPPKKRRGGRRRRK